MSDQPPDHGLEFLLAFDGRIHQLEEGYRLKFEIKRVARPRRDRMACHIRLRFTRRMVRAWSASIMLTVSQQGARGSNGRRRSTTTGTAQRTMPADLITSRMPTPCFRTSFERFGGY